MLRTAKHCLRNEGKKSSQLQPNPALNISMGQAKMKTFLGVTSALSRAQHNKSPDKQTNCLCSYSILLKFSIHCSRENWIQHWKHVLQKHTFHNSHTQSLNLHTWIKQLGFPNAWTTCTNWDFYSAKRVSAQRTILQNTSAFNVFDMPTKQKN